MIPLKQRFCHDPTNNVWGDCHRATVASLLELPLDDVPHFHEGGPSNEEANRRAYNFFASKNLRPVAIPCSGTLEEVLAMMAKQAKGIYWMLTGLSRTGCNHIVLCKGGEIVHDPSLNDSGIVGPSDDGWFWLEIITLINLVQP